MSRLVLLSLLILAGCPKEHPEDEYQAAPLPQYDPGAPARPQNLSPIPLPGYQPPDKLVPTGPQPPATSGGVGGALPPPALPAAPANGPKPK